MMLLMQPIELLRMKHVMPGPEEEVSDDAGSHQLCEESERAKTSFPNGGILLFPTRRHFRHSTTAQLQMAYLLQAFDINTQERGGNGRDEDGDKVAREIILEHFPRRRLLYFVTKRRNVAIHLVDQEPIPRLHKALQLILI